MTPAEIRAALDKLAIERRSFFESVKNGSGEFKPEEAQKKLDELNERAAKLEQQYAEATKPAEPQKRAESKYGVTADDLIALAEGKIRSITLGSTGKINQVTDLVEVIAEGDEFLNKITFDFGPNAATNIPVLEPGLEEPSAQSEGANSIASDSTAALVVTEITPKAYVAVLPVTYEQLKMGAVDIEAKLPGLFRKAFRKKMHKEAFVGDGNSKNVKGIWTSAAANTTGITTITASTTKITCSQLAGLALSVQALTEPYEIYMNSKTYQGILSDSTAGEDTKIYKESLIRNKEIEGVKVVLDSQCPSTTAAGSILAVAVPASRFHIGVAADVEIEALKKPGDTNTYFQATMCFGGKQATDSDLKSLAVPSV